MKSPFRYIIYLLIGMGLYFAIDSGQTSISHEDARRTLIYIIVGVFALLLFATIMRRKHEK